jgi:hypothetical protein
MQGNKKNDLQQTGHHRTVLSDLTIILFFTFLTVPYENIPVPDYSRYAGDCRLFPGSGPWSDAVRKKGDRFRKL